MEGINKILVVEDDPLFQKKIRGELTDTFNGAEITTANNLKDALNFVKANKFDLYLTDGQYPKAPGEKGSHHSGVTFVEMVKKENPDAKVFFIGGVTATRRMAENVGATACLNKSDYLKEDFFSYDMEKIVEKIKSNL